jgi:dihydroorotate dehydrogenase
MMAPFFTLLRPALHSLDAEDAHGLTLRALEAMPALLAKQDNVRLATKAMGLTFANPLGMAAGFDKDARVPDALMRLGFGFVEVGGVTPLPQPGNPRPRAFRMAADGGIINRYGLNSAGMMAMKARLAARKQSGRALPGILGINLGANKDSADRTADYILLARTLAPNADFLTLNISSPNTPGLRDLQAKATLDDLVARVRDALVETGTDTRLLIKIAPDMDDMMLDDIITIARARQIDGMIVSNTTIARPDSLRDKAVAREAGGLSGKPLFRMSTILLAKTFLRVEGAFPLIGVGGISSGEDAVAKLAAGASLLQLYSALVYQGPGLIGEIKAAILAAMKREGVETLSGLTGRNADVWAKETA